MKLNPETSAPKISVLMPVYNGARYLHTTISCLLAQTCSDFEIIVCDDCSTDDSWNILQTFAEKDNRIVLMQHSENKGVFKTQQDLAAQARGEFIAQQDQDDYSAPERFETQARLLYQNPEAAGTVSNVWLVDEVGDPVGITNIPPNQELLAEAMRYNNVCYHSSLMMRRSVFEKIGGYHKEADHAADYDLLLRLLKEGPLIPSSLPLATYGLSPGTVTYRDRATQMALAREIRHRHYGSPKPAKVYFSPVSDKEARTNYYYEVGKLYLAKGKMDKARSNLKNSFQIHPRASAGLWLAISYFPGSLFRALRWLKNRGSSDRDLPPYFLQNR